MSANISHQNLANLVGGELISGDPEGIITGLNSIQQAAPGEVTFLGNPRYAPTLKNSRATVILVDPNFKEALENVALIRVDNPTLAFSSVIRHFGPPPKIFVPGVHPSAVVSNSAIFDPLKVAIGPCAVIEDHVIIGDGTVIQAGVFVGHDTQIGKDCILHSNCSVKERCIIGHRVVLHSSCAIGSDGFGYELANGRHVKVEQVGIVQLDDDVEIGSCTTIDRARFGRTWIGEGTKIDNLVQVAHNVIIGKHCVIVSHVGIAGSASIGDYVTIAGRVGIGGHLEVTSKVTLLAKTGVTKNITEPGAYLGFPARPLLETRRLQALPGKIPDIIERIKEHEKRLAALESKTS